MTRAKRPASRAFDPYLGMLCGAAARRAIPGLYGALSELLSRASNDPDRRAIELALSVVPVNRPNRQRAKTSRSSSGWRQHLASLGLACDADPRLFALAAQGYLALALVALGAEGLRQSGHNQANPSGSARCHQVTGSGFSPALSADGAWPVAHALRILVEQDSAVWSLTARHPVLADVLAALVASVKSVGSAGTIPSGQLPGLLIEALVPPSLRKESGEFYTPRWLAEYVLHMVGWDCSSLPPRTLLDPTCGAGAFLTAAIDRVLASHRPDQTTSTSVLEAICSSIRGFDVSPLSVLASRVAYLCAVAPCRPCGTDLRIPVRLRDALCVMGPTDQVDFVVGNPPWVRWSNLSETQQQTTAPVARRYGLVPPNTYYGGSEVDLSAVVAYVTHDVDLRAGGRGCLVMPSIHLQAPASSSFRRFRLPDGTSLRLDSIVDFDGVRVFPGVGYHPVVLLWTKGKTTTYPVRGVRWRRSATDDPLPTSDWETARARLVPTSIVAHPVGAGGRLALSTTGDDDLGRLLSGGCTWIRGRKGILTDLNGAFFVHVLGEGSAPHLLRVVNYVSDRSRTVPVHSFEVEQELVFPLLKGASQLREFHVTSPSLGVIVPNRTLRDRTGETEFRNKYPAAYDHFAWVERQTQGALSSRSTYAKRMSKLRVPFFCIHNVGDYTFSPCKVVWAEVASRFRAAVVTHARLAPHLPEQIVVPDHKVYFAPFDDVQTAHYVCAFLNAPTVSRFVDSFAIRLQVGTIFHTLRVPQFNPEHPVHRELAALGQTAGGPLEPARATHLDHLAVRLMREISADRPLAAVAAPPKEL